MILDKAMQNFSAALLRLHDIRKGAAVVAVLQSQASRHLL